MAKYLDKEGLTKVWAKVKTEVGKKQDTLVSGTNIKTVNGASLLGSGDVTIDLSLYKVVEALPTSGIDTNKIYLVLSSSAGTNNKYAEYVYVNSVWEKLGEYEASVDLTAYAKKTEAVKSIAISGKTVTITMADGTTKTATTQDTTYSTATTSANGLMSSTDKAKLDAIASGANKTTVDSALSSTSTNPVQNKVINSALTGKQDKLTAGTNITISGSTISAKDTTYGNASESADGLMSAADYAKLAAISASATADEAITEEDINEVCV